jgi:hypothetical protein
MVENDEFNPRWQFQESDVKVKRGGGSFWSRLRSGDHSSRFTVDVPQGVDPYEFSDEVSTSIGQSVAPGTKLDEPGETPTKVRTLWQPSWVSKVRSRDREQSSVMVEADPDHMLSGRDGTSAGINYLTYPKQRKDDSWKVVTEKEPFGESSPVTNPLRFMVGTYVLDPHIRNQIEKARQHHD